MILIALLLTLIQAEVALDTSKPVKRITFGSCYGAHGRQNPLILDSIRDLQSDLFVWLGDVQYVDRMVLPLWFKPREVGQWREKFRSLRKSYAYERLLNSTAVVGIWDDHDYGINDGDKNFSLKEESKDIWLEFIGEPANSLRRNRPGIYTSYTMGPVGKQVKLILLDVRSFRDPKRILTGDTLGEDQWKWLENELKTPGNVTLIGLGIQVLVHNRFNVSEKLHPKSYERLLGLIRDKPGVILLSGDVHHTEIQKYTCSKYPIHEFTSSGMTHSVKWHFGLAADFYITLGMPHWFNIGPKNAVRNFGVIEFDWDKEVSVNLQMRDESGEIIGEHRFSVAEKSPSDDYCSFKESDLASNFVYGVLIELLIPIVMIVLLYLSLTSK